jgi:hypothetical protein
VDVVVLLDEFGMLDNLNHLDTDGVEQENGIFHPNVKKGSDHTAKVCANFDDAIHIADLAQTFDSSLQHFAMGFDKVELVLIFLQFACPCNTHSDKLDESKDIAVDNGYVTFT